MRKRSVQRWSTQPGTDALETRALLSTLVIVERHPGPPDFLGDVAQAAGRAPGDGAIPPFLTPGGMRPRGPMGPGGGHGPGDDRPAPWRADDRATPSSPPPFRIGAGMVKGLGIRIPGTSSDAPQQVASYLTAKASPSGAASKSANSTPDSGTSGQPVLSAGLPIALPKGSLGENPIKVAVSQHLGLGAPERHERAREEVLRPMFGIAVVPADTGPEVSETVALVLSGAANVEDVSPSNANPLTVPLSLYRINGPSNDLLPPPIAVRDTNGLIPVPRVSGIPETEPAPLVVRDGNGPGAATPADPGRRGEGDSAEVPLAVDLEGLPITPEVEPEAAHLGIGLLTDWIFKDPAIGEGLALAGSEVEDVLRQQSFLSVAAVVGGLTAVEVGRRIVKRWLNEDVESDSELDARWIDGELLREWSGRMSPRFS